MSSGAFDVSRCRSAHDSPAIICRGDADGAPQIAVPGGAIGDLPVVVRHAARPDNFAGQWRAARHELGVPDVSSHSFRKTVATLIDDAGLVKSRDVVCEVVV